MMSKTTRGEPAGYQALFENPRPAGSASRIGQVLSRPIMDRSNVENALTQVLENFQRCGIKRFGALPAGELPAEMLAAVAHLTAAPLKVAPPNVARRSTVGSPPLFCTTLSKHFRFNVVRRSAVGFPAISLPENFSPALSP